MLNCRKLITGLISFAAAPAIVKIENIMSIKVYSDPQEVLDAMVNEYLGKMNNSTRILYNEYGQIIFKNLTMEEFYSKWLLHQNN